MKEAIRIQLTSPCHENWQAMTPNEQGRYCQSCCKTVIDFTAMTDREIVDYIAYSAAGNTCARVYDDQLDRVIQKPRERKTWKYFWSLAIASLVLSYRSMAQVKAPKNKVVNMGVNPDKKKIPIRIGGITSEPAVPVDIEMHGRVVNESGAPVPFATVTITHPVKMIAADSAGRYSFITNDLEKFEWSVSSAGYEAVPAAKLDVQLIKSMDVSNNKVSTELKDVVLKQHTLKEAVVTAYGTTTRCIVSGGISAGVRVRRIDKVKIAVNKLAGRSDIKTYPNPAPAGGSFTVQFNVKDAGEYSVQLIDASGRIVAGRQLQIAAPGQTETFAAAALPGHGMYFIRVAGKKDGKVYNSKVEVL